MIAKRKSDALVSGAFHEVTHNTPKVVKRTRRKFGAKRARAQEIAIALAKARRAGASV